MGVKTFSPATAGHGLLQSWFSDVGTAEKPKGDNMPDPHRA